MRRRTGRRPGVMVVAPLILGLLAFAPEIPTSAAPAPSPASATDVAGSGAPAEAAAAAATATAAERASGDKITRGDADPRRPEVDLPRPVHGDTAIRLLGDQLDEAAVLNKMPADGLVELLSTDGTAWLDSGGRLFYKDPAELSSGAEPQPFAQAPLSETFTLHSKPGALRTIFLDFDGAAASATRWHEEIANVPTTQPAWDPSNNGAAFDNVELTSIQTVWASVAEDYAPFDVDVTTADPGAAAINRSSSADDRYGARALITPSAGAAAAICGSQCGGVAYGSSFGSLYGGGHGNGFGGSDGYGYQQPAWVFPQLLGPNSPKNVAEAASHEVGHQLGLDHDGSTTPGYATPDYYKGHGAWAPIMGVGYDHPVSQWSKGDYTGANRQQDDLGIIRGMLGLRADEAASSIARASALPTGTAYISSRTDTDYYLLGACAAGFTVSANPLASAANLDIKLSLVNGAGTVVTSDDPASSQATLAVANGMGATVSASAGTYYVAVDGVGTGTWAGSGYDDYGSLGAYTMSTTGTCNGAAPTGTPSVPTAAAATASTGDYSLNLSWSAPASNGGSPVTGYVVTRDGDADTLVQLGAGATGYVWPGLAAGTSYSFKVTPLNANGPGATVTVTGTTWSGKTRPSVPQGVFASWQSVAAAGQVSYTPPANPGSSYVAGYDIYRDGLYVGQARSDWLSVNVTTDAFTPGTHTMGVAAVTADGVSDIVTRSFTVPDRPANDAFAQRTALPGASGSTTGDNLESSREAADPAPPTARTGAGRASLWYSWTATSSGTLDLATSSSVAGRDTTLGVYTGAALGALTEVAGADDTSGALAGVRLTVTSGTTYAIAVDGYRQAATGVGPFGLSWSFVAAGPKVTTTSLSAVVTGRTVALRSTVTATAGNPVGSVQYFRGSVSLGVTDVSSGAPTATLTVTDEVRGDHTYTARFVPEFSTLFTTSETSAPATVAATPTTTALQASVDARNVTLTATVTQAVGTPSGLVELFEGTTSVGSGSVTNGAVSVTLTGVVPGEHTYTATYTPYDSQRYDGSGSAARTVTVEGPPPPKATATTLTGSVSGRTASLTATVTTASGGAAGTVQLTDKGVVVATAPVSGGTATFTVDDLPKGLHTFRATHVPADPAAYAASQSSDVVLFVEATASATDLTVSVSGRTVTLQSTVTPASAAAGGSVELRDGATVVGRAWLASGAAQLVLSQVPAGTHDYRATFVPADPQRYDSSLSPTRSVTLAPTPTTTALGSAVGERRVTLVATVASGEGTPSGTVEFREGGTLLATETLASGSASTTLTGVAIGSHDYTATFVAPAGSSYAGSVSAAHTSVVAPSSTATGLTVAVNGRTVSLAATATTTDGTLAGFVEFREGSTLLDTVPLASGAAALELTDVAPGPHSYRATFVPDSATHAASSSPVRTVTVRVATATDLTASAAGRTVTLDARVTGPGTPAGAVVFRDGAVVVGTSAVSAGAASLALQGVTPGEHTYTATFEATDPAAYATSTSPSRAVTVDRVATTTTLQATASGRTVTLAISVAATSGTPTGTVELRDGATFVETVTLSNGAATPALTSVAFGAHSYTATFVPTGTVHAGSVSEARPTTVLGSTTTILTATASGRTVTLSAAVTSDGTAPAGRVTFYRGGSPITAVDVTDGIATTAQSNVVPGDYTYTAKFDPTKTANHSASEATAPVTVAKVVTTTTLQAAASGRAVTIDTSVTVASGTAAGQVRFREGETLVGTVAVSSGAARLTLSTVAPGEHTYTATFVPNDAVTYAESVSAARTVTVARIATTTGLAAAVDGRTVTLTAIPATSSGTLAGAVELREGDTLLDTVPLSGGSAVLALSGVAPGQHSYTATFVPSGTTHAGSTSLVRTVTVAALSTVTGLTAQVAGRTVTLDGEVTSASGTPAGDLVVRDGTAVVGTVALVDGSATLELTDVTPGAHRFTATFVPSDAVTFAPSTSPASTVTIDPIATTTGLTATYAGGRSLTLDAQVTGASGTPAGRVVFRDGTTVVGTVDAEDGAASLTLPVGPGRHTYLATFVPTDPVTYAGSASAPRTVDADPYATSTSLSASAAGDTVALEARTTAGAAGEVVFREGGDVVGTVPVADASASVTLQGVATGEHAYTATFVPADPATYAGSVSAERTVTVKIPSATALAASVTGRTVTLDADVTVAGSATGEVVFREGDTVLGTVAVDEESATLDVEDVTAGEHRYRATFVPTSTDTVAGSVSPVATATVDPYATATELGATVDGRTVTLDVEVSSADGDPAGAVQLSEGDTLLDTVALTDGAAALDVADVIPGEHAYTARFVPADAATFAGSTSAARTVTVAPAATQISLTASADGRAVTLAADVSSDYGDPRGDVVFREGADVLDTVAVEEGVAALVLSDVDPGEHDYTATFVPSAPTTHAGSASSTQTVTVAALATRTALTVSADVRTVTLSAEVTAVGGSPAGDVVFRESDEVVGRAAVQDGEAALELTDVAPGEHTYTATFVAADEVRHGGSVSETARVVVDAIATRTALSVAADVRTVTLSAEVTAAGGTPAGDVVFREGDEVVGQAPVEDGVASLELTDVAPGEHAYTATFVAADEVRHGGSVSSEQAVVVDPIVTTTTLDAGVDVRRVVLSARVDGASGAPAGDVVFREGDQVVGTSAVEDGAASLELTAVAPGEHAYTATFVPADEVRFAGSVSAERSLVVEPILTTTDLTLTTRGQTVTLDVQVTGASGSPAGDVVLRQGDTVLETLSLESGAATLDLIDRDPGDHTYTATFEPSDPATYAPSSSGERTVTVGAVATTTTLQAVVDERVVTLTATVTAGRGTPQGYVLFLEDGEPFVYEELTSGGTASTPRRATPGDHTYTAQFVFPAAMHAESTSAPRTVTVSSAGVRTTTTLDASVSAHYVALSARVVAADGSPEGSMELRADGVLLDTVPVYIGSADLQLNDVPAGTHRYVATFVPADAAEFAASSSPVQVVEVAGTPTTTSAFASASGSTVTLYAWVDSSTWGTSPAGTVEFREGSRLVKAVAVANGMTQVELRDVLGGQHTYTATYVPSDGMHQGSEAADPAVVVVAATATQTGLKASAAGRTVTLTADVKGALGTPKGTIQFQDGWTVLDTVAVKDGSATLTLDAVTAGSHGYTALFVPDQGGVHAGSYSVERTVAVAPSDTRTALTVTVADSTVTAEVKVTSSYEVPEGVVVLREGGLDVGSGTVEAGSGTVTVIDVPRGRHTYVAHFAAATGSDYRDSSSAPQVAQVGEPDPEAAPTATALEVVVSGRSVALSAVVTAGALKPAGQVVFAEDGVDLSGAVDATGGVFRLPRGLAPAGPRTYTARFVPADAAAYATSVSVGRTVTVQPAATSTTLTGAVSGTTITLNAKVAVVGEPVPGGQVQFLEGTRSIGVANVVGERATLLLTGATVGKHTYVARYLPPTGDHRASDSSAVSLTVAPAVSRTTVTAPKKAKPGARPVVTVKVLRGAAAAAGQVVLRYGTKSVTLTLRNGAATFKLPKLRAGKLKLTATYRGNATTKTSVGVAAITVRR